MAVIVVDVLRLAQVSHTARCFWGGVSREEASVYRHWNVAGLVPGAQTASAASAPPLTQLKVLKVESPACGFEDIAEGQEQTRCNHSGPHIKIYVLEIGYGREAHVGLDGFDVNGTRAPVCAFNNGNLTDCTVGMKTVGYLYVFDMAGKQEGTFTFSNTSINAPGNTLSTQLYIK
jgi:hypothetical protein